MHSLTIRIPFDRKRSKNALARVVTKAAARAGVTPHQMAAAMSYLVEEISEAVAEGDCVSIAGFGLFGPWTWTGRNKDKPPMVLPRFNPSTAFKQTVATRCLPSKVNNKQMEKYKQNHATYFGGARDARRVDTAQAAFRQRIAVQARELGLSCNLNED